MTKNKKDTVVARPQHEGKDPLSEGERLHNVSNSSDAKTYQASNNDVSAPRPKVNQVDNQPAAPSIPAHKTKNLSQKEQDEVAKGRKE